MNLKVVICLIGLAQDRKKDFLSAKTRSIKNQIADIVKHDERSEVDIN